MTRDATITEAIQLAKSAGAYVATTASPNKTPEGISKIDYMKQLGADEVINYKEADWAEARRRSSRMNISTDQINWIESVGGMGSPQLLQCWTPFLGVLFAGFLRVNSGVSSCIHCPFFVQFSWRNYPGCRHFWGRDSYISA